MRSRGPGRPSRDARGAGLVSFTLQDGIVHDLPEAPFGDDEPATVVIGDALSDVRTMTARDLGEGDWYNLDGVRVTNVSVTAGGEAQRYGHDFRVDHIAGVVQFLRAAPGEIMISYRTGIDRRAVLTLGGDSQARSQLAAPLRVRAVMLYDYVRHIQRSDPQAFYEQVGRVMGDIRRVEIDTDERSHRRTLITDFGSLWPAELFQPSPGRGAGEGD